ncbi:MAG TPA: spore germination protein GerW family protein [Anaerolineae bacterium]|jgi:uncharacterized spore protein YtfJ|nr:spore germination protein GerW family protein [Anaerolineae bacterium]
MAQYEDVINRVMAQIDKANVEVIFGESRQIGDKVIIPVGKVSYGWGAGGGRGMAPGKEAGQEEGEGEGGGLGMGVKIKPIGYITVTPDQVTYNPIVDVSQMMMIFSPLLGLLFLQFFKVMAGRMAYKRYARHKMHTEH